ncbi:hypothetical protein WDW86_12840 [Bdellovibrionota bacterium FG-2]
MIKTFSSLILLAVSLGSASALAYTFDGDVPSDIKTQMTQDLGFLADVVGNGTSGLHQKIFGAVAGPAYKTFFESRVTGIGMNSCGSAKAVACVIPFYNPKKMWLTQNFIKFSHPQIARLMIVYHESRHTESNNGNWSHATCPTPFVDEAGKEITSIWTGSTLAGEAACDITPLGSYGSSMILLKNISKFCANCNEKVKMDSGFYADDQFKRIINADAISAIKKDLY